MGRRRRALRGTGRRGARGIALRIARTILWTLAFAAAWFAWAWLNLGFLPIAALAAALVIHQRQSAATWLVAALLFALLIGFNPDWLVIGMLAVALALTLFASGSAAASPGGTASSS